MNYSIISKSGWKAKAHTQAEAEALAAKHKQEWTEVGRDIAVSVYYYDGSLVKTF